MVEYKWAQNIYRRHRGGHVEFGQPNGLEALASPLVLHMALQCVPRFAAYRSCLVWFMPQHNRISSVVLIGLRVGTACAVT